MARARRIDAPGYWHHVMNRGARREPIFHKEEQCLLLIDCIDIACARYGMEVHAWVFMPNHFHLLVRSVRGNLSKAMNLLTGRYARKLNKLYRWDGPVFKGRFRSQLIESEHHLRSVVPYIHLNPCRAGLAIHPEDTLWSSAAAYADESAPHPFLVREHIIKLFGSRDELLKTTEALRTGREPWDPDLDLRTGFFIGSSERSEEDKRRFPGKKLPVKMVIKQFEEITGLSWNKGIAPAMGRRANPARRLAIWALRTYAGLSHKEVGKLLNMLPGTVAEALSRLRRQRPEGQLADWIDAFRGA